MLEHTLTLQQYYEKLLITQISKIFEVKKRASLLIAVIFTNIFTRSFCAHRSQKRKKTDDLTVFFTLLCSALVKGACKTLMKLTPDCSHFLSACPHATISDLREAKRGLTRLNLGQVSTTKM